MFTDNVQGQISEHIFAPDKAIVLIILQIFSQCTYRGIFGDVMCLDQSHVSENI